MTLNAKIEDFYGFFGDFGLTQVYIIHKVAQRNYRYAIQIDNLIFLYINLA